MGFTSQTVTAQVTASKNTKVTNLVLTTANTEYPHSLTDKVKQLMLRNRDSCSTKVAFNVGESGTTFVTVSTGAVLTLTDLDFSSKTLYIQSTKNGSIIEILELY